MKPFKYLEPLIYEGRMKRAEYARESGIPEEELIRSEIALPKGTVYQYKKGSENTMLDASGERPIIDEIRGQGLPLLRKPMYDALLDELRQRKLIEGAK